MARNDNWGSLPDYSNQNHTLKFHRRVSNFDTYHAAQNRIPRRAYVGGVCFVAWLMGMLWLGHFAGY